MGVLRVTGREGPHPRGQQSSPSLPPGLPLRGHTGHPRITRTALAPGKMLRTQLQERRLKNSVSLFSLKIFSCSDTKTIFEQKPPLSHTHAHIYQVKKKIPDNRQRKTVTASAYFLSIFFHACLLLIFINGNLMVSIFPRHVT